MNQINKKGDLEKPLISSEDLELNETSSSVKPAEEDDDKVTHSSIGRVLGLAGPETKLLLVGVLMMIGSSASTLASPYYIGQMIDVISVTKRLDKLNETTLALLCIYLFGSICTFFRAMIFNYAGERVVARLRCNLYKQIINQEVGFFDDSKVGELINRMSSDTTILQDVSTSNISMVLRLTIQIIFSIVLLLVSSAKLTMIMLAIVPAVVLGAVVFGRFIRTISKKYQEYLAEATTVAQETFNNVRTVRSFAQEKKEISRYSEAVNKTLEEGMKKALAYGSWGGGIGLLMYSAMLGVLYFGGRMVVEDKMTAGELTTFILYTVTIAGALGGLTSVWGQFMNAVGASDRIFKLMDRVPTINLDGGEIVESIEGYIEFNNVSFRYPTRPDAKILDDFNLTVKVGEAVALVGTSGSGKTTVMSLLQRFYDPETGIIKVDGKDIRSLDHETFHSQMAVVSQEPNLFNTSIYDNITYGVKYVEKEDVYAAAKAAKAHSFIDQFPDKYDTKVGANGVQLSGGQKQRVAIARALLINPSILLLDEATSALDAESEHLVQEAIDHLMKGRTTIVIAHRLSTVRNVDKILVIEKGVVKETGKHDDLIKKGGVYHSLVKRQLNLPNNELTL